MTTLPDDIAAPEAPRNRFFSARRLKNVAGILLLVGLVVWAMFHLDWYATRQAIANADWRYLALASIIAVSVCISAASVRLWVLTTPMPSSQPPIRFRPFNALYYASCAAHHLLPAPAAEILRTVELQRTYGYSVSGLIGSQLVEKISDAMSLTIEMCIVLLFAALPAGIKKVLFGFAAFTVAAFLVILLIRKEVAADRPEPETMIKLRLALANFRNSLHVLSTWRIWFLSIGLSLIVDGANAVTVGLVTHAVGLHLPWTTWYIVVLVARLAGLLPSTPGQFGVVEAGIAVALSLQGVERNVAFAAALLYHLAHFVPVTLVGLWNFKFIWRKR